MKCETCGSELSGMQPNCPFCGTPDPQFVRRYGAYPPPPSQRNIPPQNIYRPPYQPIMPTYSKENEPAEAAIVIFSIICPLVGFIYGLISLSHGEIRAGKTYLAISAITFAAFILFIVLIAFMAAALT